MAAIDPVGDGAGRRRCQTPAVDVSAGLRRVDLNLLLPLNALLEHRHVTRAATSLGIGQSAMSSTLARLRRLFDDPLLVRSGRALELTPMALALVDPVRDVLAGLEHLLVVQPHFDPSADARTFTVVASDYVTLILLRPLLAELYREAAHVTVNVVPVSGTSTAELERAQIDLLIVPREVSTPGMQRFPRQALFSDRYLAAVWSQNREVGDTLDLETFLRLPYVRYNPVDGTGAYADIQLAQLDVHPTVALSTLSFTLVPSLLPGTPMVAFVHERLLRASPLRRELRVLEPPVPLKPLVESMYWHPVFHSDPAHRWLRDRLAGLAAGLGDGP